MRYQVLASDYDGTAAHEAKLHEDTVAALRRLRASGRQAVLVTGRELEDVLAICPEVRVAFDFLVVENGAVLYEPSTGNVRELAVPASKDFVRALQARNVAPLYIGRCIVATVEPHEAAVRDAIREVGLDLAISLNKEAIMVLPSGIDKGSGLRAALNALGASAREAVGVGDAENDLPLLAACGLGVAVANALPEVKQAARLVTTHSNGAGLRELIELILSDTLD